MNYTFSVITKVPKPGQGNESHVVLVKAWDETNEECVFQFSTLEDFDKPNEFVNAKIPVFSLGEVLILDGSGREVVGMQRKPSKWSVETEEFDNLEDAITRSKEVLDLSSDISYA